MTLTTHQRKALKAVFDRGRVYCDTAKPTEYGRLNYRAFRRTVQPGFGCIMVPWHNMWLGIEPDGYTHS